MHRFRYLRPADQAGALEAVAATPGAAFIAGGTGLVDLMKLGVETPPALVDVADLVARAAGASAAAAPLSAAAAVEESADGVRIPASARNSDVAHHPLIRTRYPALSEAFVMKVGPARRQSELTALAWQELARDARLPLDWIRQRGAELSSAVQLALRGLASHILAQNPELASDIYPARRRDELFRKLADVMVGNCKRVGRSLLARA